MSDLGDFSKILYEKFFMRDLLGKVGPGFIASLALFKTLKIELATILPSNGSQWLFYVVALPATYVVGLALQILAELIGWHSASSKPNHVLIFYPIPEKWRIANIHFGERNAIIKRVASNKWDKDDVKSQRERFVVLKEGSGNFAMAFLVVILCLLFSGIKNYSQIAILILLDVTLFWSHFLHGKRQAGFEINVLEQIGELSEEKAKEMREFLDLPQPS